MNTHDRPDHGLPFEVLDPESRDPGYWERFRHRVLVNVGPELARRRARKTTSVSDIVFGWRNALVPTALLAAAVAALLLIREPAFVEPAPLALEEILVSGLEGEPIPAVLAVGQTESDAVLSLEESF
jgi:hypothetical protein